MKHADGGRQAYSVQFHNYHCHSATIISKRNSDLLPTEAERFGQVYIPDFASSHELGRPLEDSERFLAPMPRHEHGIRE